MTCFLTFYEIIKVKLKNRIANKQFAKELEKKQKNPQ
jgi:hypothetical protein